jgi:hypothetical protein
LRVAQQRAVEQRKPSRCGWIQHHVWRPAPVDPTRRHARGGSPADPRGSARRLIVNSSVANSVSSNPPTASNASRVQNRQAPAASPHTRMVTASAATSTRAAGGTARRSSEGRLPRRSRA